MPAGPSSAARQIVHTATAAGITVATAESLTAGQVAAALADVPGASAVLQGGVVAYQNHVKQRVLGVDAERLRLHGAVDPEVAGQMAAGARRVCRADVGVATTGVAGPEPHQGRPVGTVWVGLSAPAAFADALTALVESTGGQWAGEESIAVPLRADGGRARIRATATARALELLRRALQG
ncbi:nicotinamide-nucleotide amidohydrolase family protein [Micrococcus sp.]|uniref:CinA family protein n=1 Tax=Micrococcus sp. TaxID=1271 RepID=UPI002A90F855|nr:nicotinamide-nucleotide amidohydrolase family protein [Micrococcus sp.]MDY6055119.1 nicotinamide-nucleotide amidohydrolase family protein [Micrococcus sp.]